MTDHDRHTPSARLTDNALDALLRSAPDPAPADFADRVLLRLGTAPASAAPAPPATSRWRRLAECAALAAATAVGIGQVLAFIFGLWAATAAAA